MRYSPKPGKTEGFCIGMLPSDRDVWEQILAEVQRQRNAQEPVLLNGCDQVFGMLNEASCCKARMEKTATNAALLAERAAMNRERVKAAATVFRILAD